MRNISEVGTKKISYKKFNTYKIVHFGEVLGRWELEGCGELHHVLYVDSTGLNDK